MSKLEFEYNHIPSSYRKLILPAVATHITNKRLEAGHLEDSGFDVRELQEQVTAEVQRALIGIGYKRLSQWEELMMWSTGNLENPELLPEIEAEVEALRKTIWKLIGKALIGLIKKI